MCLNETERKYLLTENERVAWDEGVVDFDGLLDWLFARPSEKPWRTCNFCPVKAHRKFLGCLKEATQELSIGLNTDTAPLRIWLCDEHYNAMIDTLLIAAIPKRSSRS